MIGLTVAAFWICISLSGPNAVAGSCNFIYWTNGTPGNCGIWRVNIDTSQKCKLPIEFNEAPYDVEVDSGSRFLFWKVGTAIYRSDLNGKNPTKIVDGKNDLCSALIYLPGLIAIDANREEVYFSVLYSVPTDAKGRYGIRRTSFYGSGSAEIPGIETSGKVSIHGLTVDAKARKLYWITVDSESEEKPSALYCSNLDGSEQKELIPKGKILKSVLGAAVDPKGKHVYWGQGGHPRKVMEACFQCCCHREVFLGGSYPIAMCMENDNLGNALNLYWIDNNTNWIMREDLDSLTTEHVFHVGDDDELGLALAYRHIAPGLLAHHPMDGDADDIINCVSGDLTDPPPLPATDRFGKPEKAYRFSNGDQGISIHIREKIEDAVTVSLWMKWDAPTASNHQILFKRGGYNEHGPYRFTLFPDMKEGKHQIEFRIHTTPGALEEAKEEAFVSAECRGCITPGKWVHLVGTYDGKATKLFVDGSCVSRTRATGRLLDPQLSMYLGRDGWLNKSPFSGCVDDLQLYNRALSRKEIKQLCSEDM